MKKNRKIKEYFYLRRDTLKEKINDITFKQKKLEYEKMECLKKIEEIQKNLDIGKDVFYVDKPDITFAKNEITKLETRIIEIEKNIEKYDLEKQRECEESNKVNDIIDDLEEHRHDQIIEYDKFKMACEICRVLSDNIKDNSIQKTLQAFQKIELCNHIIDFDIMRTKLELHNVELILKQSINQMRNFIYYVNPIDIVNSDLEMSLTRLITFLENQGNIIITFETKGDSYELNEKEIWLVIRLIQCVIKLERTLKADIYLEYLQDGIVIQIACTEKDKTITENVYYKEENSDIYPLNIEIITEKINSINGTMEKSEEGEIQNYKVFIPVKD